MSDENGNPTEEELVRIARWKTNDPLGWLQYCADTWDQFYGSVRTWINPQGDHVFRFATGGWSWNEEIIGLMERNESYLWGLTWEVSARGGLYVFKFNPEKYFGGPR
jgi:hypothetical protein